MSVTRDRNAMVRVMRFHGTNQAEILQEVVNWLQESASYGPVVYNIYWTWLDEADAEEAGYDWTANVVYESLPSA